MAGFYAETDSSVKLALQQIFEHNKLSCYVEDNHISFAIELGDGISFNYNTEERKELLREFFSCYSGKIMYYDLGMLKPLIRDLYMSDYYDYEGMHNGIETMTKSFEDVKLITYLATNSCSGNYLLLKQQCKYSNTLEAAIGIWNVYNKHYNTMVKDKQEELYEGLFKESAIQLIQMELVGMPINMEAVHKANKRLSRLNYVYTNFLHSKLEMLNLPKINPNSPTQVQELLHAHFRLPILDRTKSGQPSTSHKTLEKLVHHCNRTSHKMILRCIVNLSKVNKILTTFIPKFLEAKEMPDGSHRLYGNFHLGGTLSGRLSSSNPSLHQIPSGSTYAKLVKSCFAPSDTRIFGGADYTALEDVVNSLLTKDPNKLKVYEDGYDSHMLRTVCYLPEQFKYIKRGVEGNVYYKIDDQYYNAHDTFTTEFGTNLTLEELYEFDLGDYHNVKQISHIEYDVHQINSLKKTHYKLREASKAVTFPLQYFGSPKTLEDNCGLSSQEAVSIYNNYHEMYKVSKCWIDNAIYDTSKQGYATTAFGLRIRTPKLSTINWESNYISSEAKAEARSVGNAISGQSYGLLTNRAANEFRKIVLNSEYKHKIQIVALIHDAIYVEFERSLEITKFVNDNLIKCMKWNELPELQHDNVKLSAELEIFHPDWSNPTQLENNISTHEILRIFK